MTGRSSSDPSRSDPTRTESVRADDAHRTTRAFARRTTSVADARTWVETFLSAHAVDDGIVDDAVLVTSELVTNALRHGLGDVVVRAVVEDDGAVHLAVTDGGDELPVLLDPDPFRVGGVGLRIVDELAVRWGTSPFAGGKTVWAVLASGVR